MVFYVYGYIPRIDHNDSRYYVFVISLITSLTIIVVEKLKQKKNNNNDDYDNILDTDEYR